MIKLAVDTFFQLSLETCDFLFGLLNEETKNKKIISYSILNSNTYSKFNVNSYAQL